MLPKTNFNFSVTFILLSANAFNLDQSKILLFGEELKSLHLQDCSTLNDIENTVMQIANSMLLKLSACKFFKTLLEKKNPKLPVISSFSKTFSFKVIKSLGCKELKMSV